MRHSIKFLIAAVLSTAAILPVASAKDLGEATSQVYFLNTSDVSGTVDIYVDGVKTESNVFNNTPSMFSTTLASGEHQVVVTKAGAALGAADVLSETVNIPVGGAYTVALENVTKSNTGNLVLGYTLDVTQGSDSQ